MKNLLLTALLCLPLLVRAELPPSAYEDLQAKAPEYLKIEILRVDVGPGDTMDDQKIQLVALVSDVVRSASGVKPNDIINIVYKVTQHPKGWVGPGEVPVPVEKDQSVAYLKKTDSGDFVPAAGRMTFSNF